MSQGGLEDGEDSSEEADSGEMSEGDDVEDSKSSVGDTRMCGMFLSDATAAKGPDFDDNTLAGPIVRRTPTRATSPTSRRHQTIPFETFSRARAWGAASLRTPGRAHPSEPSPTGRGNSRRRQPHARQPLVQADVQTRVSWGDLVRATCPTLTTLLSADSPCRSQM